MKKWILLLMTMMVVGCGESTFTIDNETLKDEVTHAINIVRVRHMVFNDTLTYFRIYYSWQCPAFFWNYTDSTKTTVETYMKVIDVIGRTIIIRGGISDYTGINIGDDFDGFMRQLQEVQEYIILGGDMGPLSLENPNLPNRGLQHIEK